MTEFALLPDDAAVLWADDHRKLKLAASTSCAREFIQLIEQTRFGSTGLRYRRLAVADLLDGYNSNSNVYVSLLQDDILVGTYVLGAVDLLANDQKIQGVYRSMLCVSDSLQRTGFGRLIVEKTLAWIDDRAQQCARTVMSFGCIERNNRSSLSLLESTGAVQIGELQTQMIYRQWPRKAVATVRLGQSQLNNLLENAVLDAQRENDIDCGLVYEHVQADNYFAVMDRDRIVAGANARVVHINFDRMGQPLDFLSEQVFAHIGPARRRFNPRDFTYLKLDGVIAGTGSGPVWAKFLSTLLAEHGTHMAMFALDPSSGVSKRLSAEGLFGRVAKATRQELAVIASVHAGDEELFEAIRGKPVGIGPFGT